ncbi:hypothetical protein XANCAGTX0491_002918 [Xanthoria calcicola]
MAEPAPPTNEPDLTTDESDSALGDDVSRYTASLTSSIQRYPVENNRRYHITRKLSIASPLCSRISTDRSRPEDTRTDVCKITGPSIISADKLPNPAYVLPNDEAELDRLDVTHQKLKILLQDKLLRCPVRNPGRVLDVGTGTGIWAIEYGDDHPDTEILGTDLSPIQPSWVPPNVKFEVDDCEEPWTFPEKFDVIHARYLASAIADWPKLVSQAFQFTKPGGYSEFQDYDLLYYSEDGTLTDDLAIQKWITIFLQAARDFGRDPCPGPRLAGLMRDAGFQNVEEEKYKIPIGPWPKDKHLGQNRRGVEPCPDRRRPRGLHATAVYASPRMEK